MNYKKINNSKEFITIRKFGRYFNSTNFIIQYQNELNKNKTIDEKYNIRLGITASKKIGGAVKRNLVKRRLKSIFKDVLKNNYKTKYCDFIIIGKKNIDKLGYKDLALEFDNAFKKINT